MDLLKDILSLILALCGIALVLYLCYTLSRFLAGKMSAVSGTNNIRVAERVALAQDKGLAIVELCGRHYLVGFSANTVEILQELDESELHFQETPDKPWFLNVLQSAIRNRMDLKADDKKQRREKNGENGKEPKE